MRKAIFVTIVLLAAASLALAMSTSDCFDCHSDDTLTKDVRDREISLFVDEEIYSRSIHGDLDCSDCHEDLAGLEDEHKEELEPVHCSNCHDDAAEEMEAAEHPATCYDCHGSHNILPADDPASLVARANINSTCATCHRGVVDIYKESIHGEIFADSPEDAPVCTSCHSAHETERAMDDKFLITVVKRCSSCHEEQGYTFSKNYHGQVTGLGYTRAAQCSDCHGAHDILSINDPASMVHPDNLVATCGKCHSGANKNFTLYMPHADYHDAERYPMLYYVYLAMVVLLTGTFAFFGIHTLLWFIRAYLENLRNRSGGTH